MDHALSLLKDHKEFKGMKKQKSQLNCCWIHPPQEIMKLNINGVMFYDQHKARMRVILRDHKGEVIMHGNEQKREQS